MTIVITPDGEKEFLVKVGPVRMSYPHLFEPYRSKEPGKAGKYGAKLLFDRNDDNGKADAKALHAKIVEMCKVNFKQSIPSEKLCLRDGKQLTEDQHGYFVLSASETIKPIVVDRKKQPVTAEDELFYPGANVIAIIRLWPQNDPAYGKRINANLVSVQFHSHGERLGGRARPKIDEIYDDISDQFDDDEYTSGPRKADGVDHGGDDGFGDGFGDSDGL